MKVTVKEKSQEKEYPWIGISDNEIIVLFTSPMQGICLSIGESDNTVGECPYKWGESCFKEFTGEITLSNS